MICEIQYLNIEILLSLLNVVAEITNIHRPNLSFEKSLGENLDRNEEKFAEIIISAKCKKKKFLDEG